MTTRGLITGGTGLLGKALLFPIPSDIDIVATYYGERNPGHSVVTFYPLDVCDADAVNGLFDQVRPDVVIHTAGIGSASTMRIAIAKRLGPITSTARDMLPKHVVGMAQD